MNKSKLVEEIAGRTGLTKQKASATINSLQEAVIQCLARGEKVNLPGLGIFSVGYNNQRMGRDPRNGAPLFIAGRRAIRFRNSFTLSGI